MQQSVLGYALARTMGYNKPVAIGSTYLQTADGCATSDEEEPDSPPKKTKASGSRKRERTSAAVGPNKVGEM